MRLLSNLITLKIQLFSEAQFYGYDLVKLMPVSDMTLRRIMLQSDEYQHTKT